MGGVMMVITDIIGITAWITARLSKQNKNKNIFVSFWTDNGVFISFFGLNSGRFRLLWRGLRVRRGTTDMPSQTAPPLIS